jgi:hypothetical protein
MDWLKEDVSASRGVALMFSAGLVLLALHNIHAQRVNIQTAYNAGRFAGFNEGLQAGQQTAAQLPAAQGEGIAPSYYTPPQFGYMPYGGGSL